MEPNTTSKNNQGINTTTKVLINPKCLQIYSNNHAFSAIIKIKLTLFNESFKIASQKLHKTHNK